MKIHKDGEVSRWRIDPLQSEISFKVRHLMVSHIKGEFCHFEANVLTNGHDFSTADIVLSIKSKSIDTGDAQRDSRLRGVDFLNADQHKLITFKSTSISQMDAKCRMELQGDLTICGVSRNVKLDMQMGAPSIDSWNEQTTNITITGKIAREDWGLRWTKAMEVEGFFVGDVIMISCKMELISMGQHDAKRERDPVALMRVVTLQ